MPICALGEPTGALHWEKRDNNLYNEWLPYGSST